MAKTTKTAPAKPVVFYENDPVFGWVVANWKWLALWTYISLLAILFLNRMADHHDELIREIRATTQPHNGHPLDMRRR